MQRTVLGAKPSKTSTTYSSTLMTRIIVTSVALPRAIVRRRCHPHERVLKEQLHRGVRPSLVPPPRQLRVAPCQFSKTHDWGTTTRRRRQVDLRSCASHSCQRNAKGVWLDNSHISNRSTVATDNGKIHKGHEERLGDIPHNARFLTPNRALPPRRRERRHGKALIYSWSAYTVTGSGFPFSPPDRDETWRVHTVHAR
eukprot:256489-Prorocentrum_minimum.AAC.2